LTVVRGERDGQNIVGVSDETASGGASVQVPETKGLVPGSGQSELAVGRDNNILNKMVVASESLTGNTVAGLISGKVPDNNALVCDGKKGVQARWRLVSNSTFCILSLHKLFN
jgi:hypothetical protein